MEVLAVYDDFSGGHWGEDHLARPGTFGGENFIPVIGGRAVKIREATTLLSNTGIGNNVSVSIFPESGGLLAIVGTTVWRVPAAGGAPTSPGSVAAAFAGDWCYYDNGILITIDGDKTYSVSGSAVTGLTGSPGGTGVAVLGDRIYVAGASPNNRLQWSDAANANSWTSTNFTDLGPGSGTLGCLERQRTDLVTYITGSGLVAEWYRISGTPGINQLVTPVEPRGPLPADIDNVLIGDVGGRLWFAPVGPSSAGGAGNVGGIGWIDADRPQVSYQPRPSNSTSPFSISSSATSAYRIAVSHNLNAVFFCELSFAASPTIRQRNLLRLDGMWSSHVFTFTGTSTTTSGYGVTAGSDRFFIAHGGSSSTKPQFYSWPVSRSLYTAPAETDGSGTAVSATLELPPYYDPNHRDIQVQAVVVDYRHYSSSTTFTCNVDALGVHNTSGPVSASTQTFTVAGAPSTVGQRGQQVFYISPITTAPGFKVTLSACRAVAIERVTVLGPDAPSIV